MTGPIITFFANRVLAIVAKSSEGGARTPVLAALTNSDENGKYITHYQSDKDYKMYINAPTPELRYISILQLPLT